MTATRAMTWRLGLLLVAALACAHKQEGPAGTLQLYGAALGRGDYRAAYALTATAFQQRTSYEVFAAGFAANANDSMAFGKEVAADAHKVPPRVEVQLPLGEAVPLVLEDGRWRVDGPLLEPWGQRTPRAALRTFIRALEQRRYDVLGRLVPARYRAGLTADRLRQYWEERGEDTRGLIAKLRAAIAAPIVESGDEAHMPYGTEQEVQFIREDGLWKIEDPD
jgi:hypothetical protein